MIILGIILEQAIQPIKTEYVFIQQNLPFSSWKDGIG